LRSRARAFQRGHRSAMRRGGPGGCGGPGFRGRPHRGFRGPADFGPDMRRRNRLDRRPGIGRRGPRGDEALPGPSA
jgi:hypothetical protein